VTQDRIRSRVGKILVARRRLHAGDPGRLVLLASCPRSMRWTAAAAGLGPDLGDLRRFRLLMALRSDIEVCRARAALFDQSDWVIMTLVVASAARASPPSSSSWR
jgi:hypothetical protein